MDLTSIPLNFISAVHMWMSSATSSGTTSLLVHCDWNFGFGGTMGRPLATFLDGLSLDAGCVPLFLNRVKSGIFGVIVFVSSYDGRGQGGMEVEIRLGSSGQPEIFPPKNAGRNIGNAIKCVYAREVVEEPRKEIKKGTDRSQRVR